MTDPILLPEAPSGRCTVLLLQDFYQIACSDSQAITQFHLEANKDDTVTVTDWDPIKLSREVCFTLDIAIPSALKRFVGELGVALDSLTFRLESKNTCWFECILQSIGDQRQGP